MEHCLDISRALTVLNPAKRYQMFTEHVRSFGPRLSPQRYSQRMKFANGNKGSCLKPLLEIRRMAVPDCQSIKA